MKISEQIDIETFIFDVNEYVRNKFKRRLDILDYFSIDEIYNMYKKESVKDIAKRIVDIEDDTPNEVIRQKKFSNNIKERVLDEIMNPIQNRLSNFEFDYYSYYINKNKIDFVAEELKQSFSNSFLNYISECRRILELEFKYSDKDILNFMESNFSIIIDSFFENKKITDVVLKIVLSKKSIIQDYLSSINSDLLKLSSYNEFSDKIKYNGGYSYPEEMTNVFKVLNDKYLYDSYIEILDKENDLNKFLFEDDVDTYTVYGCVLYLNQIWHREASFSVGIVKRQIENGRYQEVLRKLYSTLSDVFTNKNNGLSFSDYLRRLKGKMLSSHIFDPKVSDETIYNNLIMIANYYNNGDDFDSFFDKLKY